MIWGKEVHTTISDPASQTQMGHPTQGLLPLGTQGFNTAGVGGGDRGGPRALRGKSILRPAPNSPQPRWLQVWLQGLARLGIQVLDSYHFPHPPLLLSL